MSKRGATSQLNHDNWADEEEPEEAGTFKKASLDEIKKRVVRIARRKGVMSETTDEDGSKSAFANFAGFGKSTTESAPAKKMFDFLSSGKGSSSLQNGVVTATDSSAKQDSSVSKPSNGVSSTTTATSSSAVDDSEREYYRKLKGLNESVSKWISSHVSNNPLCILSPVFKDYEKHLADIQSTYSKASAASTSSSTTDDNSTTLVADRDNKEKEDEKEVEDEESSEYKSPLLVSNEEKPTFSSNIFGTSTEIVTGPSATFSFGSSSFGGGSAKPSFSFGAGSGTSPSAGFSFGGGTPFTFGNVAKHEDKEEVKPDDPDEDEPPKPDHKPVNEEGAIYTKRCKVFIKNDQEYSDRGVGNLFVKPVEGNKVQLIVRADTSLGNVLLNVLLSSSLPTQRAGKNNVAIVCVPLPEMKPPPVAVLLKVKTESDADELLETLEKHKK